MDEFAGMAGLFEQLFDVSPAEGVGPADVSLAVSVSVAEAFEGCQRTVTLSRRAICGACDGRMCAPGADKKVCDVCNGSGRRSIEEGPFQIDASCSECAARGFVIEAPCGPCDGTGATTAEVELTVQIPGGVRDGHRLRLRGAGDRTAAEPGDVYVTIRVATDSRFRREDADVRVVVELSADELEAGGVFEVPHWCEECRIEIDPDTPPGAERVLDGWGPVRLGAAHVPIPMSHDDPYRSVDVSAHRGDLIVEFQLPAVEPDVAPWAPPAPAERDRRGTLAVLVAVALLFAFIAWRLLSI